MGRAYSCWMLNCWCITCPVGFKRLNVFRPGIGLVKFWGRVPRVRKIFWEILGRVETWVTSTHISDYSSDISEPRAANPPLCAALHNVARMGSFHPCSYHVMPGVISVVVHTVDMFRDQYYLSLLLYIALSNLLSYTGTWRNSKGHPTALRHTTNRDFFSSSHIASNRLGSNTLNVTNALAFLPQPPGTQIAPIWHHITVKGKGKGRVHPRTGHEGPEGRRGITLLFL